MERSIKWYENVLGCKLVKERDNPDYKYKLAFMGEGQQSLCRQTHSCLTQRRRGLAHACMSLICIYGRGCRRFTGGVTCCLQAAGCTWMLLMPELLGIMRRVVHAAQGLLTAVISWGVTCGAAWSRKRVRSCVLVRSDVQDSCFYKHCCTGWCP